MSQRLQGHQQVFGYTVKTESAIVTPDADHMHRALSIP